MKKRIWIIIAIVAVVLIAGGILAYQYAQKNITCTTNLNCVVGTTQSCSNQKDANGCPICDCVSESPTPTPKTTSTVNTTAGWKTYTNGKYGYEIKYPPTAQLEINNDYYFPEGCVFIIYKNGSIAFGWDLMNANGSFCAGLTGRGIDNVSLTNQKLVIGGKDYYFHGDTNTTNEYLMLSGNLSDKLTIWYSLDSINKATDTDEVLRSILSTFRFTK